MLTYFILNYIYNLQIIMNYQLLCGTAGGCLGFCLWLVLLESDEMKGILFRQNDDGVNIFTPQNIVLYMMAPFQYSFFWSSSFLQHNWIVMTVSGVVGGVMSSILGYKIM